ncbi:MAG TPA: AraC family transcriptional regulator [Chthoniobacterales bacterium]|jgi:AraC family transcriptional regulator|nr:AraC family transcriptional regulator [Chthoniobacterales bacterium]
MTDTRARSLDYVDRVNRAIDHILRNLDQPLKLEAIARAACFSPFHFHRIFRSLIGEPLNEFVKRLRLERALALMSQKGWATNRQPSLTDIAFACGFDSSSDFSRCFKQRFGVAPSRFSIASFRRNRREEWQTATTDPKNRHRLDRLKPGANPDGFQVRLRRLPPRCVAYVRVRDCYREGAVVEAVQQLTAWAEPRGLAGGQWLGYMWDNPEITAHQNCRYDIALVVPAVTPGNGIGRFEFPATEVAEIEIRGGVDLELRALDWLFGTWLPSSGFVPTDQPGFEAFVGRPFAHGTDYFELHIQLPVTRG